MKIVADCGNRDYFITRAIEDLQMSKDSSDGYIRHAIQLLALALAEAQNANAKTKTKR